MAVHELLRDGNVCCFTRDDVVLLSFWRKRGVVCPSHGFKLFRVQPDVVGHDDLVADNVVLARTGAVFYQSVRILRAWHLWLLVRKSVLNRHRNFQPLCDALPNGDFELVLEAVFDWVDPFEFVGQDCLDDTGVRFAAIDRGTDRNGANGVLQSVIDVCAG